MAVQLLIVATEQPPNPLFVKGMIVTASEEPAVWGKKEQLPNFCKVRVSDGTKEEAERYSKPWMTSIQFNVVGDQVTATISPKIIEHTDYRFNIDNYLFYKGLTKVMSNDYTCIFNCAVAQEEVFAEIKDVAEEQVSPSPYVIPEVNVDNIVAAGGFMEVTKEYAKSIVVDRRL